MKKNIFVLMLVLIFGFMSRSICSAYLEERLQCDVNNEYIQVFLWRDEKLMCMDYVRTLESSIKVLYKNLLLVDEYLNSGQDLEYWTRIYTNIEENILSNQLLRLNILKHMETFELNLFYKLKEYISYNIQSYKKQIILELSQLDTYDFSEMEENEFIIGLVKRKFEIEDDLEFIEEFENVENMESLVLLLPRFFDLARKIGL